MNGQRSWYLWLSQRDYLPRNLQQVVRVSVNHVMDEEWSSVTINSDLSDALFTWSPPEGWTEYVRQKPDDALLKPGTQAPDFELDASNGHRYRLSHLLQHSLILLVFYPGNNTPG